MSEQYRGSVRAPEFPNGLEWLNTDRPLAMEDLRGKVVLLDFWTYCCINCLHMLPQLRKLEERYREELVIIAVHSAKYPGEKDDENVRQAVTRYNLRHPVVNDPDSRLGRMYGMRVWPTLVLIDPAGRVVGMQTGEFQFDAMAEFIGGVIADFDQRGEIRRAHAPTVLEAKTTTYLSYPSKLAADAASGRLYVADTHHHRIVIADMARGVSIDVVGCGEPGFRDGPAAEAAFQMPHGVSLAGSALYVADTENHAVRAVDLETGAVRTVAGTGEQAQPIPREGPALATALNSPWDLLVDGRDLVIAMAGCHQLWHLELTTAQLVLLAGSGEQGLLDGPREKAMLAQPSGLALARQRLYFVDSESSALRQLHLTTGRVETIIGKGLFEFGDMDGAGPTVRLQHPLAVVERNGLFYVADSYNHKIKMVGATTKSASTVIGTGRHGREDGTGPVATLWEPGGLSVAGDNLYIADTNNHAIRVADMRSWKVTTLG
jgi:thiol-disulfide isomerase/thioredoxin